jgi:ABC1 atypical kinase-like domain
VFPLYSSRRILVTEWIDGEKLIDRKVRVRREDIATTVMGIRNALTQFLDGGFTHCDLHNGNILRLRDTNQLAFIDFGVCASMPEYTRQSMSCAIMHLIHCDYYALAASFVGMSLMRASDLAEELPVLADALRDEFEVVGAEYASEEEPSEAMSDVGADHGSFTVVDSHSGDPGEAKDAPQVVDSSDEPRTQQVPLLDDGPWVVPIGLDRHFSFIGVVEKLIRLSGQFPLKFGDYFLSNLKCLAMLEGLALNSDPDFNILEIVYPFVVSKVLTDPALPFQDARRELMLDISGRVRMECLECLVRTRNASGIGNQVTDVRRGEKMHRSDGPCEVVEFILSRDGCLIRRELRRQFIADWCALSTTWLDRHVFRRWDLPSGRGGRRSWWWSTSRASATKRHRERAAAVRAISRARDNWRVLSALLGATLQARLLRRARLVVGLLPVATGCMISVLTHTAVHTARRCIGVLARAIATGFDTTHKLWLAI